MRYFRATQAVSDAVRLMAMGALQQPNGKAVEPWRQQGDFVAEGMVYLALAPHQYTGEFWESLIEQAITAGVEEVSLSEYIASRPNLQPIF